MKPSWAAQTFQGPRVHVLAHQGGWDEILLVVGPLVIVGLLLWMANRRVAAQLDASGKAGERSADSPDR